MAPSPSDFVGLAGTLGLVAGAWLSYRATTRTGSQSVAAELADELAKNQHAWISDLAQQVRDASEREQMLKLELDKLRGEIANLRSQLAFAQAQLNRQGYSS